MVQDRFRGRTVHENLLARNLKLANANPTFGTPTGSSDAATIPIDLPSGMMNDTAGTAAVLAVTYYLSDTAGALLAPTVALTGASGDCGSLVIPSDTDVYTKGIIVANSSGTADLVLTSSGNDTFLVNIILPSGQRYTSTQTSFDGFT